MKDKDKPEFDSMPLPELPKEITERIPHDKPDGDQRQKVIDAINALPDDLEFNRNQLPIQKRPWDNLNASLDMFSDDFKFERKQPKMQKRDFG